MYFRTIDITDFLHIGTRIHVDVDCCVFVHAVIEENMTLYTFCALLDFLSGLLFANCMVSCSPYV